MPSSSLQSLVDQFDMRYSRFEQLIFSRPDTWRRDYLGFRREMLDLMQRIRSTICSLEHGACAPRIETCRQLYVRVQHLVALHQAEWPVVAIDLDHPAYVASTRAIRAAWDAFAAEARTLRELKAA
jgi:hypothetical protein